MAIEKKVETLEGEIKLMKGELKETLTNVRDFLLNLKLPPPQIEGLESGDGTQVGVNVGLSTESAGGQSRQVPRETLEVASERPAARQLEPVQPVASSAPRAPAAPPVREAEALRQPRFSEPPVREVETLRQPRFSEPPEEEEPSRQPEEVVKPSGRKEAGRAAEPAAEPSVKPAAEPAGESTAQVNLLANLLRWVSVATREIGSEQLPVFLDVYGTTGNLSPEMREVILSFASILEKQPSDGDMPDVWGHLMSEQLATFLEVHSVNGNLPPQLKEGILRLASSMARHSGKRSIADIWSQLILELHGILTGGGTPLQPMRPAAGGGEAETGKVEAVEEPMEESVKTVRGKSERVGKGESAKPKEKKARKLREDRPVTLKLVLPASDGVEKEFSINLAPEVSGED